MKGVINMIELTTGKKTGTQLAKWFGISYGSFRNKKSEKLEELKLFAEFYEENGKVVITKVLEPIYQKGMMSVKRKVIEKIDEIWSADGLDSCQRVGEKILETLQEEDKEQEQLAGHRQGPELQLPATEPHLQHQHRA